MGCCQAESVINIKNPGLSRTETINPDYGDDKFDDFPQWTGERYSGIGIKRMKGYICNLPIDQLLNLREEFWLSKNYKENNIWTKIREAILFDEYRTIKCLEKNKLKTYNGCINHIVDSKGNHYYIPNFCINEPYFEKDFELKDHFIKKDINIILYETTLFVKVNICISNMSTGKELKEIFAKKANVDLKKRKLRMFFGGNEIKDEHLLAQHNLDDEFKIQVMIINI